MRPSSQVNLLLLTLGATLSVGLVAQAQETEPIATAPGLDEPIEISEQMLERFLADYPEMRPEEGVQNLVDTLLLAQIARRRGLMSNPFVQERLREALAWTYLKTHFEPKFDENAISAESIRRLYEANQTKFVHPTMKNAVHIVVGVLEGKRLVPPQGTAKAKANAILEKLHSKLAKNLPKSSDDFMAASLSAKENASAAGLEARIESLGWFSPEEGRFDRGFDPAFRLACAEVEAKEISSVFQSSFGLHLVWVSEVVEAKNETIEVARPVLSKGAVHELRRKELERLSEELALQYEPISEQKGLLRLMRIKPLIRLEAKRPLPEIVK